MRVVCCVDEMGRITRTSSSLEKITGKAKNSLHGLPFDTLFVAEDQPRVQQLLLGPPNGNAPAPILTRFSEANRHYPKRFSWSRNQRHSEGYAVFVGTAAYGSEPQAESPSAPLTCNTSEKNLPSPLLYHNFPHILAHTSDALVTLDIHWRYTYANARACRLLSKSSEQLLGKNIWEEVFPEKKGGRFHALCLKAFETQTPAEINNYLPSEKRWFHVRLFPSPDGMLIFFTDRTEEQEIKQKAKNNNEKLQDLLNALDASSILSITDKNGHINWVNENFCLFSQYSFEELLGRLHGVLATTLHPSSHATEVLAQLQQGKIWKGEISNHTKTGQVVWASSTIIPFMDEKGEPTHHVVICQDITERKKTEKALQESEKIYRLLIEHYSEAVFITDLQGRITLVNKLSSELSGKSENELLHMNFLDILPSETRSQLSSSLPLMLQGKTLQIRTKISDFAKPISAEITIAPIQEENTINRFFFRLSNISNQVNYEKDIALLNNTSRALGTASSIKEGMAGVVQLLCQYAGFEYGEFWMPMLGQTRTRMVSVWEAGNRYQAVTEASLSQIWDARTDKKHLFGTGTYHFVPSIRTAEEIRRKEVAMACGLHSFLSIPLISKNKMLGVIGLWSTEDQKSLDFDPSHLQSLVEKLGGELERRQNNEELKNFFNLTPDLFCIIGFDDLPKRANPALQALLGYTAEDVSSIVASELIHPDDQAKGAEAKKMAYAGIPQQNLELRVRRKDGSYRWLSISTQSSVSDGLIYLVGRDQTVQKKQLEEIERIKVAIENTSDAIGIAASAEETIYTNRAFKEVFGWEVAPMNLNGGPRGLFVDTSLPDQILATLASQGRWEGDIDMYDGHGNVREVNLRADAILDEQGNFKYLVGIFVDIAEKNKAQLEIKKLSKAVEESGNEVYIIDTRSRKFSYINNKGLENLGYTKQDIALISPLDVNPDYDRLSYKKLFHPLLVGQVKSLTYQTNHRRRDGSVYPVEAYLTLFHHGQETSIMAHAIDITERKKAEEELRMINERYLLVTKATQDAIWDWDILTNKGYFGEGYHTLFGIDPSKAGFDYWAQHIHPEDKERVINNLLNVASSQQKEWTIEYRFLCADGSYKFIKDRGYVIRDAEGNAVRMTGALSDISEHKKSEELLKQFNAELEAKVTQKTARLATTLTKMQQEMLAREQVEHNLHQSLQEKEVLLKEIHHRVKNNMAIISGLLSLQARHSQQAEVKTQFRESQQRIKSMALTHELLYQHKNLSKINFQRYIQELIEGIAYTFRGSETEVSIDVDADNLDLDILQAVPCGLILNELITNCYKYAFAGKQAGTIKVNFRYSQGYYLLQVSDNGIGLPANFNSQKSNTLGMQLVYNLVRQLGGRLESQSEHGASFTISFKTCLQGHASTQE